MGDTCKVHHQSKGVKGLKETIRKQLASAGVTIDGNKPYDVQVLDERFYRRFVTNPSLGAGESYMNGWWDCERVDELFYHLLKHRLEAQLTSGFSKTLTELAGWFINWQTKMRSLDVAKEHYNLGNSLYEHMLGTSMSYTCAYWKDAKTLDQAQDAKHDLICRKLDIKPNDRVLDLGCGFGGFAKYAAENYKCEVVAVNIAEEQVKYAREFCKGLPVTIFQSDYRDPQIYNPKGIKFDKVASIGLCEHIGPKNYLPFLKIVRENLKPEGLFLLHTIGKDYTSSYTDPWIRKYIFPHGVLPSIKQLSEATENIFVPEDLHNFSADYDKTLMAWHKNFNDNWEKIRSDYDDRFYRMWVYYLLQSAGAFRSRTMQLWQFVMSPTGVEGGYQAVR